MNGNQTQEAAMEPQLIENPDGSATVLDPEQQGQTSAHDENLAENLSDSDLFRIASEICELIGLDKNARKERDELYEEGIKRTGLGDEAPGGAQFDGASRAVHPVLAEACVDYSSSAIKELFPPDGPVKIHNFAENTSPDEIERAENKRDFMNWQLVDQAKEYRSELEVLLTQQPLSGSQYLKVWWDIGKRRPCFEFVPSDLVILPYSATTFSCSPRVTVVVPLTKFDYEKRVKEGIYRDIDLIDAEPSVPEETSSQKATDKIEGKSEPFYNKDGLRNFYEVYIEYDIDGKGDVLSYIITIDEISQKIAAIYRNWDEEDPEQEKLEWIVDFNFIPWRGAGGIGLTHLIGSLAGSATGALRALLDSAHLNNFPGAIKLKGARASGQSISIGPTEVTEIEAPANVDDIRKVIMPLPFPQPSPVLFQLLGWLTEAAKGVVTTAEEKIADASNQMPVGTTLALIEQGSKVMSAIHMRLHEAQKCVLNILQRLNYKYYDPEIQMKKFGRILVPREDFMNTGNIVPVSDPFMFSESQRFAQIQSVLQMAQDPSVPWNKLAIYKRILRMMHVPSPQEFLQEPPPPVSADPITEIVAAMSGQQIAAQPQMDHMLHLREQLEYLLSPIFGAANPALISPGFQIILNDIYQHLLFMYQQMKQQSMMMAQQQFMQVMGIQMQGRIPPEAMQQFMMQQMQNPAAQAQIGQLASQAFAQMSQQLVPIGQAIQQATELVKSKIPPPMDPQAAAAMQVTQMQEQTKQQIAQMRQQIDQAKMQQDAAFKEQQLQLEAMIRLQLDPQLQQQKMSVEIEKNNADNERQATVELIKNRDDNQTELIKAQIAQEGEMDRKVQELSQQVMMEIIKPEEPKSESKSESKPKPKGE